MARLTALAQAADAPTRSDGLIDWLKAEDGLGAHDGTERQRGGRGHRGNAHRGLCGRSRATTTTTTHDGVLR